MIKVIEQKENKLLIDVDGMEVFIMQRLSNNAKDTLSLSVDDRYMYLLPKGENCVDLVFRRDRV